MSEQNAKSNCIGKKAGIITEYKQMKKRKQKTAIALERLHHQLSLSQKDLQNATTHF